jgi:nucleoid DNA-binding protein
VRETLQYKGFAATKKTFTFLLLCYLTRAILPTTLEEQNRMAVRKKTMAKKRAAKKAPAKRVATIKTPMTKSAMMGRIADDTGLTKKEVSAVFDSLATVINGHIKKGGAGTCTIPGLMKIKTVRKPATRARKGINPFTGEEMMFKAKPARNVVKVLALKNLKDMA